MEKNTGSKSKIYRWNYRDLKLINRLREQLGAESEVDTLRLALALAAKTLEKANK
jgi:hypothetical protein